MEHRGSWLRRFLGFVAPYKRTLTICLACALLVSVTSTALPLAIRSTFDRAVAGDDALWPWLTLLLGLGALRGFGHFYRRSRIFQLVWGIEFDLRNAIYERLQRLDFARHDQLDAGQLVSRSNADVQALTQVVTLTPMTLGNLLMFLTSVVVMLTLSPLMASVLAVTLPLVAVTSWRMGKRMYPSSWDMLQWQAEVAGVVEESVTGVRVVKGFGQERRQLGRLIDASVKLFGSRMRNARIQARYAPTLNVIPVLGQLVVLAGGGYLVIEGRVTLGTFLAFQTYLTMMIWPARDLAWVITSVQQARAAAERVFEILDAEPVIRQAMDAVEPAIPAGTEPRGRVELDDVTFGYRKDRPVLRGASLVVEAGERIALVGGSGSGKTSLALLLPRFYDVDGGAVRVDGQDVRTLHLEAHRRRFGIVFEESFLFSESVRANIAYGHADATDEQVEAAARAAAAHDFILELADGYDTVVGERGHSLSGGQRQRIALARALLTDPDILILDDATSSIDVQVEQEIHETLRRIAEGRTTILVAHRRSTLELATRIVVLDEGRVLDTGTHEELLARCPAYRRLLRGDEVLGDEAAALPELPTPEAWPPVAELPALAGRSFLEEDELDEELLEGLADLGPIVDEPRVDVEAEAAATGPFRLRSFLRPYRGPLLAGVALVLGDVLLSLAGPAVVRRAVDRGIVRGDTDELLVASMVFFATAIGSFLAQRTLMVFTSRTAQRILLALRIRIFAQLQRLGIDFYEREMAGRIMTRATSDIDTVQTLFQQGMLGALAGVAMFAGSAFVLLAMNPLLASATLTIVVPLVLLTRWFQRRSDVEFTEAREQLAAVNASFQESLSGVRVAQAFVREEQNLVEFRRATTELRSARNRAEWVSAVYVPAVDFLSTIATVIVLAFGASLITRDRLTAGGLVAFVLYLSQVFGPVQQLSQTFSTYQQANAALRKMRELFDTPVATPDAPDGRDAGRISGSTELDRVRFAYTEDGADALDGVSLDIPAGQTIALVGETGAGKSTVMKLVARFYDPTDGDVRADGSSLRALETTSYRRNLGYVPQEAHLFAGTIRDNIAFARPEATEAEVEAAARAVGAHDFIADLPLGYRDPVRDGGRSMSAGQRQLVALARALLVDPVVLLLDEATANLDLATEARVAQAMGLVSNGRTTILIAHRLQTAARADRIVVIDDGHIVEDGTHGDLLAREGRYAALWAAWEAGEEEPLAGAGVSG
jgi:ATP-binding cassette, subfamily B, bacterial